MRRHFIPAVLLLGLSACGGGGASAPDMAAVPCVAPKVECEGLCVDTMTFAIHCGACGHRCNFGETCRMGKCALLCQNGLLACGEPASCVNPMRDPDHCGACGAACKGGQVCAAGRCECPPGTTDCGGACVDIMTSLAHCGDCATACKPGFVCSAGACALACQAGLTRCDPMSGPLCANLQTDNTNCGACGTACPPWQACQKGVCAAGCPMGLTLCGNQCADLQTDGVNCGACAMACPQAQVCVAGRCVSACAAPLVPCNGACVDSRFDPANCGACGTVCKVPGATAACLGGKCVVGRCDAGFGDCDRDPLNGCEIDLRSDANNCQTCGRVCALAHAASVCAGVMGCAVGACDTGFGDCDFDPQNGCEVDQLKDVSNCGACGTLCPPVANGGPGCRAGVCGIGTCKAGYADCDAKAQNGCEIVTATDVKNCGACGTACANPPNAAPACAMGACGLGACNAGYTDCNAQPNDGCECATGAGFSCVAGACLPLSCNALKKAKPGSTDGVYSIAPDGMTRMDVYCDMTTAGGGWTLLMKLVGSSFCFASANWTSLFGFNEAATLDASVPAAGSSDAKSRAFYLMPDVTSLRFLTTHGQVTVSFLSPASAMTLMTTNTVPFAAYPDYTAWRAAFTQDRCQAPIFMRAGIALTNGNTCRSNPQNTPSGCGQLCTFCFQASDGCCCGCNATANDVSAGVGLNSTYCGAGLGNCSSAGTWSDPSQRTLVWGR